MDVIAVIPHLWIVPVVGVILAAVGFVFFFTFDRLWKSDYAKRYDDMSGWRFTGICLFVVSGLALLAPALMLMPYESKYHVMFKLEGTVESVTNTFEAGSGELSSVPVIELSGYDDPILVSSSRVMTLEGADVELTCTLSWEPFGLDVTHCGIAAIR